MLWKYTVYTLEIYCLYSGNILSILWKYIVCTLEIYCLYSGNILYILWKYIVYTQEIYCLYSGNILYILWKYIVRKIYSLSAKKIENIIVRVLIFRLYSRYFSNLNFEIKIFLSSLSWIFLIL